MVPAACIAALAAVLVALAGSAAGPVAALLAVPAAVGAALAQRRAQVRERQLRTLSLSDPLTGLGNRRVLEERLAYEIARHSRHERQLCVVALDLDGFKQVNDRFGHQAGDEVLREVARALRDAVRKQDTVVRLGGDEFCVLAPESGGPDARRLAMRLNRAVADAVPGLQALGASAGWAVFPHDGTEAEALLARADAAAIDVKRHRAGRERRRAA